MIIFGAGGYRATTRALTEMSPDEIVDEMAVSGLRAGVAPVFRTGKMADRPENRGSQKYIICNAAESDLDSAKDRSILENNPHSVIEGMIIAGYAVGATQESSMPASVTGWRWSMCR